MATIVDFVDNNSNITVVVFSGMGGDWGHIPPSEFMSVSKKYNALFVKDDNRTWYNHVDVDLIKSYINPNQKVITLGNSMGAFNACCFTNDFPVEKCIMFSTQYSVHPKIMPEEKRYKVWTNKTIKEWKIPHLTFNNNTQYYIIQGTNPKETRHTDRILDKENIHKFFIQGGHKIASKLKAKGLLHDIIFSIIENRKIPI